nr:ATP-grasp domain-containing protein [Ardenticatenales bacterium]
GSLVAARASAALNLPHNAPLSAEAARNKHLMRQTLQTGGVPVPHFRFVPAGSDFHALAEEITYPVVVKPLFLSGSRGVIRADDPDAFVHAAQRTQALLRRLSAPGVGQAMLVEEYLPGGEVAIDGLLIEGVFHLLALFDKPDPLEGPFFEETIYVTPSRLPETLQATIVQRTQAAAAALGLRTGPVHAELRFNERGVWLIEIAGRSIGGLCGSILEFGTEICLEDLIVRQAVGLPLPSLDLAVQAAGVMMIPIPRAGILRAVRGVEEAARVPGITGIEISAPLHYPLVPLPEGESYLGFLFARAESPASAEAALREAHGVLHFEIEDEIPLLPL